MVSINRTDVSGFRAALHGMRNAMASWDKSDSRFANDSLFEIGKNDLDLACRLIKGGTEHRKFLRMINVSFDITAPVYWMAEFDTYKVGTVANSTSTMHKIHAKEFSRDDFSHDRLDESGLNMLDAIIDYLECERQKFLENKEDRQSWHNMIQMLPSS